MRRNSLFLAALALLLWSFLAYLGSNLSHLPPFLLVGILLSIGGILSLGQVTRWRVSVKTFLVGVGGIFGYHFLLFSAFRAAPVVEANLINYLWPLLLVLMSPIFLAGHPLRKHHVIGGVMGLAGAALIVTGGHIALDVSHLSGYLFAFGAAVTWACYSLMTKRLPTFPTAAVGGFCLSSGLLALLIFWAETGTVKIFSQISWRDWMFLALLGIGPMGAAFFAWDAALKRGDPRIIGSLAYLTPLASTLILVLAGGKPLPRSTAIAMILIIAGAVVGSLDVLQRENRMEKG